MNTPEPARKTERERHLSAFPLILDDNGVFRSSKTGQPFNPAFDPRDYYRNELELLDGSRVSDIAMFEKVKA